MRSSVEVRPLGELVINHNRRRVPIRSSNRVAGPYPYYGAQGIVDYVNDHLFDGEYLLVAEDGENLRSRSTPVAQIASGKFWVNNHAHVLEANELSNNWFLEAAINQSALSSFVSGSAIPKLSKLSLHKIPIPCPPKAVQDSVGGFLKLIADRIANNRALAANLESIARAIFKSWFVDFDPVRAKMEGREPEGMDPEIAALFPDRLVESELGLVPEGWEICNLTDIARPVKGRSYKSAHLQDSDTALVTLKSFNRGGGFRPDGFKAYAGPHADDQVVEPGECVVACTDVTQNADVIGRAALVRPSPSHSTLVASLDTLVLRPIEKNVSSEFLYLLCGTERYVSHVLSYCTGTTVLHLSKQALPSFRLAKPGERLLSEFSRIVGALFEKISVLEVQSNTLSELRDSVLPRLVMGRLSVREVGSSINNSYEGAALSKE